MFELTNEQRQCFALKPVQKEWARIELKASPYDTFKTFAYVENNVIVKCITVSVNSYSEYELSEAISDDGKYLLPKTAKGRPVLLSSSTLLKRNGKGMCLCFNDRYISLFSYNTERDYYSCTYDPKEPQDIFEFVNWVKEWCADTTEEDIADINNFANQSRKHIKYKEGDVFRFKIDRRLYGYGRILLDYDKMRKQKEPFWDILMSKPLVCSVYHIVTQDKNITLDELKKLKSLPSTIIADNALFYGEHEIIGNIPVTENEDYPIMYGNSISFGEKAVCLQCGKTYKVIDKGSAIYSGFINNGVSFSFKFTTDILMKCIEADSNDPYWENYYPHFVNSDLRNPKFRKELEEIAKQFNIPLNNYYTV